VLVCPERFYKVGDGVQFSAIGGRKASEKYRKKISGKERGVHANILLKLRGAEFTIGLPI
jgi:hypothetical protein